MKLDEDYIKVKERLKNWNEKIDKVVKKITELEKDKIYLMMMRSDSYFKHTVQDIKDNTIEIVSNEE